MSDFSSKDEIVSGSLVVPGEPVNAEAPNRGTEALAGSTDVLLKLLRIQNSLQIASACSLQWNNATSTLTIGNTALVLRASGMGQTLSMSIGSYVWPGSANLMLTPLPLGEVNLSATPGGGGGAVVTPSDQGDIEFFATDAALDAYVETVRTTEGANFATRFFVFARRTGTSLQLFNGLILRNGVTVAPNFEDQEYVGIQAPAALHQKIWRDRSFALISGEDPVSGLWEEPSPGQVEVTLSWQTFGVIKFNPASLGGAISVPPGSLTLTQGQSLILSVPSTGVGSLSALPFSDLTVPSTDPQNDTRVLLGVVSNSGIYFVTGDRLPAPDSFPGTTSTFLGIDGAKSQTWADSETMPLEPLRRRVERVVDLLSSSVGGGGAAKIGSSLIESAGGLISIAAGEVRAQLISMANFIESNLGVSNTIRPRTTSSVTVRNQADTAHGALLADFLYADSGLQVDGPASVDEMLSRQILIEPVEGSLITRQTPVEILRYIPDASFPLHGIYEDMPKLFSLLSASVQEVVTSPGEGYFDLIFSGAQQSALENFPHEFILEVQAGLGANTAGGLTGGASIIVELASPGVPRVSVFTGQGAETAMIVPFVFKMYYVGESLNRLLNFRRPI